MTSDVPITTWVVEANAAQRFMLQYEHVRRWVAQSSVSIISHQTHRNKTDPNFGIQTSHPTGSSDVCASPASRVWTRAGTAP